MADTALTPADERRLMEIVMAHDAPPGQSACQACGLPHPCTASADARRRLIAAGIDLDLASTIWS
ncbi:hypothetical protein GCM10023322_15970 [Rugosimonospora acidiphila]|uniref:Uncharacterized protein n=1 Tax=Rugosimonospora acidiphila TaxID=556531 RepID=A0ABP9RNT0_9ACTN